MDIKNIFGRKNTKDKGNKLANIPKSEIELSDVPNVVFEDFELQVTIGQWLGILSSQQSFGTSGITIYAHLSARELMKKVNIPTQKIEEIVTKFGLLLKLAGIDNAETCILSQFDKDNFSFNCHFNNSGNDAKISLRWGSMMDYGPQFIIDYPNENKTYDYHEEYNGEPIRLELQSYTIKNSKNGSSCYRYLSPYKVYFTLKNGEYCFLIEIDRPKSIKVDVFSNYVFRLKNEEQLQQYLLGLTFPLKIDEVYNKICEISTNCVEEYPNFEIRVERKIDKKNNKKTDLISLKHGQFNQFIITKNGITISIDNDGNWSYDSQKFIISQNNNGNINYSLNSMSSDELFNGATPFEHYNKVSQEVEKVRKLTKDIIK